MIVPTQWPAQPTQQGLNAGACTAYRCAHACSARLTGCLQRKANSLLACPAWWHGGSVSSSMLQPLLTGCCQSVHWKCAGSCQDAQYCLHRPAHTAWSFCFEGPQSVAKVQRGTCTAEQHRLEPNPCGMSSYCQEPHL